MPNKQDIILFMKELRQLLQDYQESKNEFCKKKISKDILFLSSLIYETQIGRSYEKNLFQQRNSNDDQKPIY